MKLMQHQASAVEIADKNKRYGFFWEPGTGKTIAMLDHCRVRLQEWRTSESVESVRPRTLVICPLSVIEDAWMKDAKHYNDVLSVASCWAATRAKRLEAIRDDGWDVAVINFESFKVHARDFIEAGVNELIIDESSKIKNWKSQISKTVQAFSNCMSRVYLLSGTPAPNDETEYWPQLRCLEYNTGELVSPSFYAYANRYMFPVKKYVARLGKEVISRWSSNPSRMAELGEVLGRRTWALRKEDCVDLPPKTFITRHVSLNKEEAHAYALARDALAMEVESAGGFVGIAAEAQLMKMRQLSAGQVLIEGATTTYGNSKLLALGELIEEIGNQKVVIWAEFTHEINRIVNAMKAGYECEIGRIDGKVPAQERARTIREFQDGDLRFLVCHPAAAGHGITLTAASYSIYYSLSFSHEQYAQSQDRIHRVGQSRPCTYYLLVASDTVDEVELWSLRNKRGRSSAMLKLLEHVDAEPEMQQS